MTEKSHKIAAGTKTVVQMGSEDPIKDWAIQTGQTVSWTSPYSFERYNPRYAEMVTAADGSIKGNGFLQCEFVFSILDKPQLDYINTTFFSSARYASVTIQTYDEFGDAFYMTCTALRPQPGAQMNMTSDVWTNVVIRFVNGVEIT